MFLILRILLVQACDEPCVKCVLGEEFWLDNICENTICRDNLSFCNNNCENCTDSGNKKLCSKVVTSAIECPTNTSICGNDKYLTSKGKINISYPFPQKTLCEWTLDMREFIPYSSENSVYITIINPNKDKGYLKVLSYNLPNTIYDISGYKGNYLIENWNSGVWINDNIITILYASGTESFMYSGILITWEIYISSSTLSLESIIAIITVSVVLFLCFSCCIFCCFKCTRAWRIRGNRGRPGRGRIYQVLPDNSVVYVSDENINACIPASPYNRNLVEVGDPICPICFEEFTEGIVVRKTSCKHIFHASCIEHWMNNNSTLPTCPVCKTNPFTQLVAQDK